MDNIRNFLRGVMDLAMVVIPLSVVLGVIFGPAVPFIGADVIDNISALVSDLCRGHQGTLFAILPECSPVLQNVGFEIADTFTTWQLD